MGHSGSWLFHDRATCLVEVCGLPLIHDKTVDEWGTAVLGYFMTGPPATTCLINSRNQFLYIYGFDHKTQSYEGNLGLQEKSAS
jgi:hypothetical protein